MLVVRANALDYLKQMEDESVDCVVTSPPYYGLRLYEGADTVWGGDPKCEHDFELNEYLPEATRFRSNENGIGSHINTKIYSNQTTKSGFCKKCGAWYGQLGLEPTVDMFIDHLLLITKEIKRVLKKTGTFFLNINDTYSGSHCGRGDNTLFQNTRRKYIADQIYNKPSPQAHSRIPDKSLMLVPERLTIRMVDEQGWILRNKIIWFKPNGLPSSAKDRFTNKWEYVFFFVKSRKYYFDLDAVRKPYTDPARLLRAFSGRKYNQAEAQKAFLGNVPGILRRSQLNQRRLIGGGTTTRVDGFGYIPLDLFLPKQSASDAFMGNLPRGINEPRPSIKHDLAVNRKGSYDDLLHTKPYNPKGVNPGDVIDTPAVKSSYSNVDGSDFMDIATRPHKFAHFAVYPESLIEPLIKAGCPEGGIVLDPFAGSGTTGVVAKKLNRDAILIEISEKYVEIIKQRLASILP